MYHYMCTSAHTAQFSLESEHPGFAAAAPLRVGTLPKNELSIYIWSCISLSLSLSLYIYIYIYIYIYVPVSVSLYIYLSIYLYLYMHLSPGGAIFTGIGTSRLCCGRSAYACWNAAEEWGIYLYMNLHLSLSLSLSLYLSIYRYLYTYLGRVNLTLTPLTPIYIWICISLSLSLFLSLPLSISYTYLSPGGAIFTGVRTSRLCCGRSALARWNAAEEWAIYLYMKLHLSLSLSLSIYIYVYIYTYLSPNGTVFTRIGTAGLGGRSALARRYAAEEWAALRVVPDPLVGTPFLHMRASRFTPSVQGAEEY